MDYPIVDSLSTVFANTLALIETIQKCLCCMCKLKMNSFLMLRLCHLMEVLYFFSVVYFILQMNVI